MEAGQVLEWIKRDAVQIFDEAGLSQKLTSGRKLTIKLGADPSRPDLHLGHSVVLRKLRMLQTLGHEIVFVIGDFTGMIGDPSGKSKTRVPLTFEETRRNGQSYFQQVTKILDPERTRIAYNSEWLSAMGFAEVLQLAGKYTLARILERDDFSRRYGASQPIGLHELLYPLMQGYDSVMLHADIEVGGTDQTFNLLVGRELQRDYGQTPQEVITFPLLPGLDGVEKMSKSLDNYIGIDEPAEVIFEKCMKIPDSLLADYFRLTTDLDTAVYEAWIQADVWNAHRLYGQEIVRMYHGQAALDAAQARYAQIAAGMAPEQMEIFTAAGPMSITELLVAAALASSKSEARRLIAGKGVKLNGQPVEDYAYMVAQEAILSRGRARFVRVLMQGTPPPAR